MFNGIIERVGSIAECRTVSGGRRLRVDLGPLAAGCHLGDSVCVSGVCLTVAVLDSPFAEFDVISETLDRTTLGALAVGDFVNLERSLSVSARVDGHFVQGHVDGVAVVDAVVASAKEHVVSFRPDSDLRRYLIPKGSVAIDGVSLTIAALRGECFSVALIPTTLRGTTAGALRTGVRVNIETDMIVRTIVHHLSNVDTARGLSLDSLHQAGFA